VGNPTAAGDTGRDISKPIDPLVQNNGVKAMGAEQHGTRLVSDVHVQHATWSAYVRNDCVQSREFVEEPFECCRQGSFRKRRSNARKQKVCGNAD
jgi:hypothetical protein